MGKIKTSKKHQRSLEKSRKVNLDKVKGLTRVTPFKRINRSSANSISNFRMFAK